MKSRSKFRPSDNRQRRLGFVKPQLELLEDRLQPSIVFGGQEWAFLAADPLAPDPNLAANHTGEAQPLQVISSQQEKKPLATPAAAAPVSGGQSSDFGAVAQPALPSQSASQNSAPGGATASAALNSSAKQATAAAVATAPTTVRQSFGAYPLTELQATVHIVSQQTQLTPAPTHNVPQQINTAASQNWATYVTGTPTLATGNAVTVDANGNAYVTGATNEGTTKIAYIAEYDPSGNQIFLTSFQAKDVGANGTAVVNYTHSEGNGIALDGNGNIYVVGTATNSKTRLQDAFVMRFSSSGTVDSTYGVGFDSGGAGNVTGTGIAVGTDGTATIVGGARVQGLDGTVHQDIFLAQVAPNGIIPTLNDGLTGYAFAFAPGSFVDSQGNALFSATLGSGIALSPDGSTGYISGTGSAIGASTDILVMSFNVASPVTFDFSSLSWTLTGGLTYEVSSSGPDTAGGIVVGADGTVYQAGTTTQAGSTYALVISYTSDLTTTNYAYYDNTTPSITGTGITVDPTGNVYVTGTALDGLGVQRALVDELDPIGQIADTQLLADNGSGQEAGSGIAYSNSSVFVTGITSSTNLSTDTTALNGAQDAFLANVGGFLN